MASPIPLPVPAGYDPSIPLRAAAMRYGVSRATLGRWRRELGYTGKAGAQDPWTSVEDQQLKANFNTLSYPQLADLIGRTASAVKSRAIALGLRKAATQWQRDTRAKFDGIRAKGTADLAADHVRCHDRVAIFRCDENGLPNPKGAFWKYGYGSLVLSDNEMIAKAERKGWKADAWRELAPSSHGLRRAG